MRGCRAYEFIAEHRALLLPVVVLAAACGVGGGVRLNDIQPYVLPGPLLVLQTLVRDWAVLSNRSALRC